MNLNRTAREDLLAELASMPDTIWNLFGALPAEDHAIPGPDGMFSPVEQVWHLADLEVEGFGFRIEALKSTEEPQLPDFDGAAVARARDYRSRSLEQGMRRFAEGRRQNLRRLGALAAEQWNNAGTQEGVGRVALCDMPAFLQQHDAAHLEEIRAWFAHRQRLGPRA